MNKSQGLFGVGDRNRTCFHGFAIQCPSNWLHLHKFWCGWRDSNSQNLDFESSKYTNSITSAWWAERELNSHSTDYESAALPLSYQPNIWRRVWESNPLTVADLQFSKLLHYRPAHSPKFGSVLSTALSRQGRTTATILTRENGSTEISRRHNLIVTILKTHSTTLLLNLV